MVLYLKVKPNQSVDKIENVGDEWVVKLRAAAIDGKANKRLIELLSKVLKLSKQK